jgi:Flp pilus assembly protein TadD
MPAAADIRSAAPRPPPAVETVFAAVRGNDIAAARRLSISALAAGFEHPLLLNLRAMDHEEAGRFQESLADLRRAHLLAPRDFGILNACGLCLGRLERNAEALQCFDQVLALAPDFGPGWFNRGWALERTGEKVKAAEAYARAAALNPENAHAWANLAFLEARRGDHAAARTFAEKALAAQPGHTTALLVLAELEMGEPTVAEARLRALLDGTLTPFDRGMALGQLGDVLDAQQRFADAFAAYTVGNLHFQDEARAQFEAPGQVTIPHVLGEMIDWAGALPPAAPGRATPPPTAAHVFLLGFPRSGTTVIESALAAHPDIVTLEERNTFYAGVKDFLMDGASMRRLDQTSDRALAPYRDDYWSRVAEFGVAPNGRIFIDKNPLHTLKLPLIYRLFPDARLVFSIRDPRDVVLSCFRRRFTMNPSTYEFLDLQRTAAHYVEAMTLADLLRERQPMAEHQLVYERLVEDFRGETKAVCDFIGASWRDDLVNFAARAKRGEVASASSQQISRGLYSDGAGQWRRYRTQLSSILDTLAPWVERFGYAAD